MTTSIFVNLPSTDLEKLEGLLLGPRLHHQPDVHRRERRLRRARRQHLLHGAHPRVPQHLHRQADHRPEDPGADEHRAHPRLAREVDAVLAKGLAAGGTEPREAQDLGFMYSRDLEDPDGNILASSSWSPRPPRWAPRPTWPSREPRRLRLRPDRAGHMATRAARGFGQYSGAARALERVGDRWALLIVRDLLVGARRYGDLKAGLPRIPTNILSDRLKELQESGVIRRVPTVRGGYELTTFGRALEPVVVALERWGWSALGEPAEGEIVTADALAVALRAAFRPDVAAGAPPTEYVLHVGVASVGAGVASGDASIGAGSAGERPGDPSHRAGEVSVAAVVANATLEVTPIGPGALPQPRRGDAAEVAFEASAEFVLSAAEFRDLISGALEPGRCAIARRRAGGGRAIRAHVPHRSGRPRTRRRGRVERGAGIGRLTPAGRGVIRPLRPPPPRSSARSIRLRQVGASPKLSDRRRLRRCGSVQRL